MHETFWVPSIGLMSDFLTPLPSALSAGFRLGRAALAALCALGLSQASPASADEPPALHSAEQPSLHPAAQTPPPLCPAMPLAPHKFAAGERLTFGVDAYGADIGTLEVWLESPPREERPRVELIAHARAKASLFVNTNLGNYATLATSRIGPGLAPLFAHEEVEDNGVRWLHEFALPAAQGKLAVRASKDGEPQQLELPATPSARDLLSTFFAIRASVLTPGTLLCFEVYAGRHLWKMTGAVGPHEVLDTPLGKLNTVRLELSSQRLDDPRVTRSAKFWISDDARRLPVAAVAEFRGKVLRAQLQSASGRGWTLGPRASVIR